eukprot:276079-Prymnesium_polylepis.2
MCGGPVTQCECRLASGGERGVQRCRHSHDERNVGRHALAHSLAVVDGLDLGEAVRVGCDDVGNLEQHVRSLRHAHLGPVRPVGRIRRIHRRIDVRLRPACRLDEGLAVNGQNVVARRTFR